jgi:hypothetical protein
MVALVFVLIVLYSGKNVATDIAALVTGRTPPSHERQMARIKAGTARRATRQHGSTMGSFFADAYGDAWEAANDWRHRKAQVAARNRHAKWAEEDREFVKRTQAPTPVDPTPAPKPTEAPKAKTVDPATVPTPKQATSSEPTKAGGDGSVPDSVAPVFSRIATSATAKTGETPDVKVPTGEHGKTQDASTPGPATADPAYFESEYQRYAMRLRNGGKSMTSEQVQKNFNILPNEADEVLARWSDRYKTENASRDELKATYKAECEKAMALHDAGHVAESQVHIDRAADVARKMGITSEEELFSLFQETQAVQPAPAKQETKIENAAEQTKTQTAETQKEVPAVTTTTTAQNGAANAETIGLRAGLTFLNGMSTQCKAGAENTEISITSLTGGEVGPGITGKMAQAQELLNAAAALYAEAYKDLEKSIAVKEAYDANPDAGNKQFLTTE